jgi:hypothetical protein
VQNWLMTGISTFIGWLMGQISLRDMLRQAQPHTLSATLGLTHLATVAALATFSVAHLALHIAVVFPA